MKILNLFVLILFSSFSFAGGSLNSLKTKTCADNLISYITKKTGLKIIGAGGFGTVYDIGNNKVVKVFHTKVACGEAKSEFQIHHHIYSKLNEFRTKILPKIKEKEALESFLILFRYLHVPQPHVFCEEAIRLSEFDYSCSYVMNKAHALPMKTYWDSVPNEMLKKIEPELIFFNEAHGIGIHAHLAFSYIKFVAPINTFQNVGYGKASTTNPLRGYIANRDRNTVLEYLRRGVVPFKTMTQQEKIITEDPRFSVFKGEKSSVSRLGLSAMDLSKLIGMTRAILYYYGRIIMIDQEFTIGYNKTSGQYMLNLFDFGKCKFDKEPVDWSSDAWEKLEDLYSDYDEANSGSKEGWNLAQKVIQKYMTP